MSKPERKLPECFAQQVLKHPLPNESSAERLQQVGFLYAMLGCQQRGEVLTAEQLTTLCGLAASQTSKLVEPLIQRGLVHSEPITIHVLRVREPLEGDCDDEES